MIVTGYKCDNCNNVTSEEFTSGVILENADLFNGKDVYRRSDSGKSNIDTHVCMNCMDIHVLSRLEDINRADNEQEYDNLFNHLTKLLYAKCFRNRQKRKR